jgi:putative ABC transport system permease protein
MSLGRSKLNTTPFLAINDIISSPKRFGIISLTFVLCLSLLLILSTTVKTLKSDTLLKCFSVSDFDLSVNNSEEVFNYMKENGQEKCKEDMAEIEDTLAQNGIPAECKMEFQMNLPVEHGKIKSQIFTTQGVGTTMDMYEYMEGTPPQNDYEIAITKSAADILNAHIGDTIKIETMEGKDDYLITAIYQTMANQGTQIRMYSDKKMNYLQVTGAMYLQIKFTDSPDDKEISRRIDEIKKLYPQYKEFKTGAEFVEETTAVAEPLNAIKLMFSALTII